MDESFDDVDNKTIWPSLLKDITSMACPNT